MPTPSPSTLPRTAKEVIDTAIRENRSAEIYCYVLVGLFSIVGIAVLIIGAMQGQGLVALAGSIASSLFWPALSNARAIRLQNLMIRMLEVPLQSATTAESAAKALEKTFLAVFQTSAQKPKTS